MRDRYSATVLGATALYLVVAFLALFVFGDMLLAFSATFVSPAAGAIYFVAGTIVGSAVLLFASLHWRWRQRQRMGERLVALETRNKQLERQIEEHDKTQAEEHAQLVLAEALRDSASALNQSLELEDVLDRILSNVGRVVPHDMASVRLLENGRAQAVRAYVGQSAAQPVEVATIPDITVENSAILKEMVATGDPVSIPDTSAYKGTIHLPFMDWVRSYVSAPICRDGEALGILSLGSAEPHFFSSDDAERLGAFAGHAAMALENAQLYRQAQELASLQERQRLARDLHDAVSQTLWAANIIADVLPALWARDPERGVDRLRRLRQLNQGALAEMHTLLYELQPATLLDTTLDELMRYLASSIVSRTGADVEVEAEGSCELPALVHLACYRIAQEATQNIIRHARASKVQLKLRCEVAHLTLSVRDNGLGFNPDMVPPGRLGLEIMRERASAIGASLSVVSQDGQGTTISVSWSDTEE